MDRKLLLQEIRKSEINQENKSFDGAMACQVSDLPIKIIEENCDIFPEVICKEFNKDLKVGNFPCTMKLTNIIPAF